MSREITWLDNPTKKQASIIFFLWLTQFILSLLAMTDFFNENPFQKTNSSLGMLLFATSVPMFLVIKNYFKKKTLIIFKTLKNKMPAANIGFAKVWQDIVTSAAVHYQLWLGAGLFLKEISIIL